MTHDWVNWATVVNFTIYFVSKKQSQVLDHLSTYELIQDFVDDDEWIYVLMMRSSSRLTQLWITGSIKGTGITDQVLSLDFQGQLEKACIS